MADNGGMMIVGPDRYNPGLVPKLETYVDDQVRTGSYDLEANLALLRHYNFSPDKANNSTIAKILIKAQMRLPEHDFSQMLHLIPERLQEEQPVTALIVLSQHLEGARFQAYWQAADACKDVVGSVPGYYDAIRAYITTAITSTCQKASKPMLAESLRLDGAKLDELVESHRKDGWSEAQAQGGRTIITFPKIEQNASRTQGVSQGFKFDVSQLSLLLQTVQ